jgi:hypothetical protein
MFKVEKSKGRWGRDLIIYSKLEKELVKDFIMDLYQNMGYPSEMTSKLTKIWWKFSYIRGSELHIRFNIAWTCPYKINYLEYPKFSYFYNSDRIDLSIPFDALLQFKRDKLLNDII